MTVETEAGYTWTNGTHARMLHAGNSFRIKQVTATADPTNTADLVTNDLTRDRWVPRANVLDSPTDFDSTDWTATNATVDTDNVFTEDVDVASVHYLEQSHTFAATTDYVYSFRVERRTITNLQVRIDDGTAVRNGAFNLQSGVAAAGSFSSANILDLGNDIYEITVVGALTAGSGNVRIYSRADDDSLSYDGSGREFRLIRATLHQYRSFLDLDTFGQKSATCVAVGAHNLGGTGGSITLQYQAPAGSRTTIGTVTPPDDSPIMFFFDAVDIIGIRFIVDDAPLPEIGVIRVGDPLTFQQPFYAGFTPSAMNRNTEVVGNLSRTGDLLGRSKKRTILSEQFAWEHLKYTWVRDNLDGPNGVIQALEDRTAFIAWRPEEDDDVSYIMRAQTQTPQAMGLRDFWQFSMSAEVYSYE